MIIKIQIINKDGDDTFKEFEGDELTSPEQQAILFIYLV